MNREAFLTVEERDELELTILSSHPLGEQFQDMRQQHDVATLGMWVFLATEVMFFGALFVSLGVYYFLYREAFEAASARLVWEIGALNTVVLLLSSLTIVLAVHFAQLGRRNLTTLFLVVTALLGLCFLGLKGIEYAIDFHENLVPGWNFEREEWTRAGLTDEQVPHVQLFLLFYWIMTLFHAVHVTIGIGAVMVMAVLSWRGNFSPVYYSPVDVTALYWHFVDIVWIFLLPMLYLLGRHHL